MITTYSSSQIHFCLVLCSLFTRLALVWGIRWGRTPHSTRLNWLNHHSYRLNPHGNRLSPHGNRSRGVGCMLKHRGEKYEKGRERKIGRIKWKHYVYCATRMQSTIMNICIQHRRIHKLSAVKKWRKHANSHYVLNVVGYIKTLPGRCQTI